VHSRAHVAAVAASAGRALTHFDADTAACARSFEAASLAAGTAVEVADAIVDGGIERGFAAVRPPGHHAESDRAMGFCFFNNAAVVARHLTAVRGLSKVLILDWDVHHGNGTQQIFYDDADVMYVSLHQYPFYPGTGSVDEVGRAKGEGFTANLPMPAGAGDDDYMAAMRDVIIPLAMQFDPEFVLVSAGFDAHKDDPLASIDLTTDAFARMSEALNEVAERCCRGRLMMLLEGGYNLQALRDCTATVCRTLIDPRPFGPSPARLSAWSEQSLRTLRAYWKI
jgi:acetoin utilization deacetylase AcuC-like enzyme